LSLFVSNGSIFGIDFPGDWGTIGNGPAMAGWTVYPPLSALPQAVSGSGFGMTLWLVSMSIFIAGSLLGSLNYIVTVLNLRTSGMTMTRMPLTIWAFFCNSNFRGIIVPSVTFCGFIAHYGSDGRNQFLLI